MLIALPSQFNVNNFSSVFQPIVGLDRNALCTELIIDFQHLDFIEPTGVTILANLVRWLLEQNISVRFRNYNLDKPALHYLHDSGFFLHYVDDPERTVSRRNTTKSLEFMDAARGLFWIRSDLLTWLVANSGCGSSCFRELLVCIHELFQNIRDHADINIGSIHAQYFPLTHRLCISLADIGIGIPTKVRTFLGENEETIKDSDAIIKACEYGFTTSSNAGNQGRGLANLTDIVTRHYNGKVIIISDKGFVQYQTRNKNLHNTNRDWLYPGTLIDIDIRTDQIPHVEDELEDFEW